MQSTESAGPRLRSRWRGLIQTAEYERRAKSEWVFPAKGTRSFSADKRNGNRSRAISGLYIEARSRELKTSVTAALPARELRSSQGATMPASDHPP